MLMEPELGLNGIGSVTNNLSDLKTMDSTLIPVIFDHFYMASNSHPTFSVIMTMGQTGLR